MQRDKVNGGHLQPRGSTEDPDPGPVALMGTSKTGKFPFQTDSESEFRPNQMIDAFYC